MLRILRVADSCLAFLVNLFGPKDPEFVVNWKCPRCGGLKYLGKSYEGSEVCPVCAEL